MNWLAQGARGRIGEFNRALEEAGLVRCEKCREPCEEAELEEGRCAECQGPELTTAEEICAGSYLGRGNEP